MLHYNTVNALLKASLLTVMKAEVFSPFRLVGGTALSLHLGHRESIDIDLFSDAPFGSLDFVEIEHYLKSTFSYVDSLGDLMPAMGKSFTIGKNAENAIKLDVFYTDPFIQECVTEDGIRLAAVEEIVAMKIDVVQREGRKKDFWDLHELLGRYSIDEMLYLHEQRYPYSHQRDLILKNFTKFDEADNDLI